MKYWIGILFSLLHISVSAQEYMNAKSWINDIVNSELQPSGDLMEYKYSYGSLVPSFSLQDIKPYQFKISDELINITKWNQDYYQPHTIQSIWKPTDKWLIEGGNFRSKTMSYLKNHIQMNFKAEYKLTDRLSINLSGYYMVNNYKNQTIIPDILYISEIVTNLSYNITKNFKIKTGMQYVYNMATRDWEYMYLTGFVITF